MMLAPLLAPLLGVSSYAWSVAGQGLILGVGSSSQGSQEHTSQADEGQLRKQLLEAALGFVVRCPTCV